MKKTQKKDKNAQPGAAAEQNQKASAAYTLDAEGRPIPADPATLTRDSCRAFVRGMIIWQVRE